MMERTTQNADNSHEEYTLVDGPRSSYEELMHGDGDGDGGVHIASVAEKKRLWWRNATINAMFIAAWCVYISS